jgi:hypothetical protein
MLYTILRFTIANSCLFERIALISEMEERKAEGALETKTHQVFQL